MVEFYRNRTKIGLLSEEGRYERPAERRSKKNPLPVRRIAMMYIVTTAVGGVPDKGRTFFCTGSQKRELVSELLDLGWESGPDGFSSGDTDVYIWEVATLVHLEYTKGLFQ